MNKLAAARPASPIIAFPSRPDPLAVRPVTWSWRHRVRRIQQDQVGRTDQSCGYLEKVCTLKGARRRQGTRTRVGCCQAELQPQSLIGKRDQVGVDVHAA